MPYYVRLPNATQRYVADVVEALSVEIDAGLVRAPYTDTWQVAGDGIPVPTEVVLRLYHSSPSPTPPPIPSGVIGAGWESPSTTGHEWEREVLAVRRVRVSEGGVRGGSVELAVILSPRVGVLYRWITEADEVVDQENTYLVFVEEV